MHTIYTLDMLSRIHKHFGSVGVERTCCVADWQKNIGIREYPTCSAMAPKTAMKAMKTATKGPKSMKPMRATTAKGKSKNAKDKSTDKNKSVTDELRVYNFKHSGGNHKSILGPTAKVNFCYEGTCLAPRRQSN